MKLRVGTRALAGALESEERAVLVRLAEALTLSAGETLALEFPD